MVTLLCPRCKEEWPLSANYCAHCGKSLRSLKQPLSPWETQEQLEVTDVHAIPELIEAIYYKPEEKPIPFVSVESLKKALRMLEERSSIKDDLHRYSFDVLVWTGSLREHSLQSQVNMDTQIPISGILK